MGFNRSCHSNEEVLAVDLVSIIVTFFNHHEIRWQIVECFLKDDISLLVLQ